MGDFFSGSSTVANESITTEKLAAGAVTTEKLANLAVSTAKLAGEAVTNEKIGSEAVGETRIKNAAVSPVKQAVAAAYGALTERKVATSLEASATEPIEVKCVAISATAVRTFIQLKIGAITVDQSSVSVAATGTGHLQLSGIIPATVKWEVVLTEGTLEPANSFFSVYHAV